MITGMQVMRSVRGEVAWNRLIGNEGMIEVGVQDGPQLRLRNGTTGGMLSIV